MTQYETPQARRLRPALRPRPDMPEDDMPVLVLPDTRARDDRPVNRQALVDKRGGVEVTAAWFPEARLMKWRAL